MVGKRAADEEEEKKNRAKARAKRHTPDLEQPGSSGSEVSAGHCAHSSMDLKIKYENPHFYCNLYWSLAFVSYLHRWSRLMGSCCAK